MARKNKYIEWMGYGANCFCTYKWRDPFNYKNRLLPEGGLVGYPSPRGLECESTEWNKWMRLHKYLQVVYGYDTFYFTIEHNARSMRISRVDGYRPNWEKVAWEYDVVYIDNVGADMGDVGIVLVLNKGVVIW